MSGSDTRLRDVAQSLLDNIGAELANRGINVPTRQYITAGDVAQDLGVGPDCDEAFIVSWNGTTQGVLGVTSPARIQCAVPVAAQFSCFLLRCVPTLDEELRAPSTSSLQESGESILIDAITLTATFVDLLLSGDLLDTCRDGTILNVLPVGPSGGMSGTQLTVAIGLV